jgi:ABC-2 type transport system ATP-binding protein
VPSQGQMRVLGHDVARDPLAIRMKIGYMPENDAHIPGMNAVSFVAYCAELSGLPRADAMQRAHDARMKCCSTSGSAKPATATSTPTRPA